MYRAVFLIAIKCKSINLTDLPIYGGAFTNIRDAYQIIIYLIEIII
jgi:hypothetical protein